MTSADESRRSHHELPIDPDVDVDEDARHHHGARPDLAPRPRWPHFQSSVVASVFAGGCIGGLVRYLITKHWSSPDDRFPWSTFTINIAGAFVLAVLIVIVSDVLRDSTYARPLIGTGFCGALTTFSSVVVEADELIAHGHAGLATTYVVTSIIAGLVVASLGVALARAFAERRPARQVEA